MKKLLLPLVFVTSALTATASCGDDAVEEGRPTGKGGSQIGGSAAGGGGGADGGAGGSQGVTDVAAAEVYLDGFLGKLCSWFVRCEPKLGAIALGELACHPVRADEISAPFIAAAKAGTIDFDPVAAKACLDKVLEAECNVASLDLRRCDLAFVGRVPEGDACGSDLECQDGSCTLGTTCPGQCVVGHQGNSCKRPSDCKTGLTCISGSCQPMHTSGQSCSRFSDCTPPLTCRLDGTCGAPPTSGESCRTGAGGDLCGGDLVCRNSSTTPTCGTGSAPGGACSGDAPCAPGGRCFKSTCVALGKAGAACQGPEGCAALHRCENKLCIPAPSEGDACDETTNPCVEGLCVSGKCKLLADGETCRSDTQFGECQGYCSGSTCAAKLGQDAACTRPQQCGDGFECREGNAGRVCLTRCSSDL